MTHDEIGDCAVAIEADLFHNWKAAGWGALPDPAGYADCVDSSGDLGGGCAEPVEDRPENSRTLESRRVDDLGDFPESWNAPGGHGMTDRLAIREAEASDADKIWAMIEPVIRAGESYAVSQEADREEGLAYWFAPRREVFVAEVDGKPVGTYFIQPNQKGGGSHVANGGYLTAAGSLGRGIGRAMCLHSLRYAKARGYRAMQFNFVLSTNERAVRLWESLGFSIAGRLPEAYLHPRLGYVDVFVMHRFL